MIWFSSSPTSTFTNPKLACIYININLLISTWYNNNNTRDISICLPTPAHPQYSSAKRIDNIVADKRCRMAREWSEGGYIEEWECFAAANFPEFSFKSWHVFCGVNLNPQYCDWMCGMCMCVVPCYSVNKKSVLTRRDLILFFLTLGGFV